MRRYVKALSGLAFAIEVVTYILLVLSLYTVVSSFASTLSPSGEGAPFKMNITSSDALFSITARNAGMLDMTSRFKIEMQLYGENITREKKVSISPGGQEEIPINIGLSGAQSMDITSQMPRVFVEFESRTLGDSTGIGFRFEVGGGG